MKQKIDPVLFAKTALAIVLLIILFGMLFKMYNFEMNFRDQGKACNNIDNTLIVKSVQCPENTETLFSFVAPEGDFYQCCRYIE